MTDRQSSARQDPVGGFRWREQEDGTVLYRPDKASSTYVVSKADIEKINWAGSIAVAAFVIGIMLIFVFNGRWWFWGYGVAEYVALIFLAILPSTLLAARAVWIRSRILAKSMVSERQIEVVGGLQLGAKVAELLTRKLKSGWLWLVMAVSAFALYDLASHAFRFIEQPVKHYGRGHQPGPLDGIIQLPIAGVVAFFVVRELLRRRKVRARV